MKIEAVVVRDRVETVMDAVEEQTGHVGVTVIEAVGHGRQRGITHEYRGRIFESRFLPKAHLTFVVARRARRAGDRGDRRRGTHGPRIGRRDLLGDARPPRHAQPHGQEPGGGGGRMTTEQLVIAASTIWVVFAAILVMFMQAGFAFLEAGLTRMKNVGHIAAKNVLVLGIASVVYYVVGFGIAFGDGGNGFIGGSGFAPDVDTLLAIGAEPFSWFGTVPAAGAYFFQVVFAAVSLAIVWGAMAERTKLWVYFAFGIVFTLIYSVVAHWIWHPDGWLFAKGMQDFAGSTVVHYQGALAALAGALLLGPRLGKFGSDGKPNAIPGHNMAYTTLGVIILWFGWFGFNAGSTLGIASGDKLGYFAYVALTTNVAAAAGGARRRPRLVARDQEARPLDDAERCRRRARRGHGRVRLRRPVGGDPDRLRRRRDRRRSACSSSSGSGSTTRSAPSPCTAWPASGARSRPASSRCRRSRRTSPPARAGSGTPARSQQLGTQALGLVAVGAFTFTASFARPVADEGHVRDPRRPRGGDGRARRLRARHVGLSRVLHPRARRLRDREPRAPGPGTRAAAGAGACRLECDGARAIGLNQSRPSGKGGRHARRPPSFPTRGVRCRSPRAARVPRRPGAPAARSARTPLTAAGQRSSSAAARAEPVCLRWRSSWAPSLSAAAVSSGRATTCSSFSRTGTTPAGS